MPNIGGTASSSAGIFAPDFTAGQLAFIERLAGDTGLDSGVVAAWVFSEENGTAAAGREAQNNHNWLNIGYFDSGAGAIAFNSSFSDPRTGADQTAKFLKGIWGGASTGIKAILGSVGRGPSAQIGAIQSSGWASSGYPGLPTTYGSLSPTFKQQIAAGTTAGGTFGAGGTGGTANQPSNTLWQVGDPNHPDQDYWTTINQYSMDAQWYTFSDAETLYVADGIELMAQQPQAVISRLDPAVIYAEATYDNTAFAYTTTHKRKAHKIGRAHV